MGLSKPGTYQVLVLSNLRVWTAQSKSSLQTQLWLQLGVRHCEGLEFPPSTGQTSSEHQTDVIEAHTTKYVFCFCFPFVSTAPGIIFQNNNGKSEYRCFVVANAKNALETCLCDPKHIFSCIELW